MTNNLIARHSGTPVPFTNIAREGDPIVNFRGAVHTFLGVTRAASPGRSAKVATDLGEYYAEVFPFLKVEGVIE